MKQIKNNLEQFELDADELTIGMLLPDLNKAFIQNYKVDLVKQKINITFDPESLNAQTKFAQEEAYIRGQIDALDYLLTMATTAETLSASPDKS